MRNRPAFSSLFALALLTLLSLSVFAGAQTTFESAKDKVAPLFGNDPEMKTLQTVQSGDETYAVFYYSVTSPNRLFAAIRSSDGQFETSPDTLSTLAHFIYRYDVLYSVMTNFGLSVSAQDSKNSLPEFSDTVTDKLNSATKELSNLEHDYPSVDFTSVSATLDSVHESFLLFGRDGVQTAKSARTGFEADHSLNSFAEYYRDYNQTLTLAGKYVTASYTHFNAVNDFSAQVRRSASLTSDAKADILKRLPVVQDVGSFASFKTSRLNPGLAALAGYEAAEGAWVNETVDGFSYRKAKVDAATEYQNLQQSVPLLLTHKTGYASCGVSLAALETAWNGAQADLKLDTIAGYQSALTKLNQVNGMAQDANNKYDACLSAPATQHTGSKQDYTWLYAVVLLVIGAAVYLLYLRNKHAQEEAEAQ